MTSDILAIAGAGTTLLGIVAIVVLVYKLLGVTDKLLTSMAAEYAAERDRIGAETARDAALAAQRKAEAERDKAIARLADVSVQRNNALVKVEDDVQAEASQASDGAASLAVVDRELAAAAGELPPAVPGVPHAGGATAGTDHRDAGQDAVHPAEPATSGGAGRGPAG